jgi:hypothetical protein
VGREHDVRSGVDDLASAAELADDGRQVIDARDPHPDERGGIDARAVSKDDAVLLQASDAPATFTNPARERVTLGSMFIRLLRIALQVVLFFLLLSLVVAVASSQTGTVEKVALIAAGAVLVWLASRVRRIGAPGRQA